MHFKFLGNLPLSFSLLTFPFVTTVAPKKGREKTDYISRLPSPNH